MTVDLPLMKNALTPLVKSVLLPFGLSAAMSATDAPKRSWIRYYSINNFK